MRNEVIISGRDLLPISSIASFDQTQVIFNYPLNPLYWSGTRVSITASTFQNYRPLQISLHYIPHVGTQTTGSIILGTIQPQQVLENANLASTLIATNAGTMGQVYARISTNVNLKRFLQQNSFNVMGQVNDTDNNPLNLVGVISSSNTTAFPGFIYITWKFSFKNPIVNNVTGRTMMGDQDYEQRYLSLFKRTISTNGLGGVALGILKTLGIAILKTVVVKIIDVAVDVLTGIKYYIFSDFTADTTAILSTKSNDNTTELIDANSNRVKFSDNTPCYLYYTLTYQPEDSIKPQPDYPYSFARLGLITFKGSGKKDDELKTIDTPINGTHALTNVYEDPYNITLTPGAVTGSVVPNYHIVISSSEQLLTFDMASFDLIIDGDNYTDLSGTVFISYYTDKGTTLQVAISYNDNHGFTEAFICDKSNIEYEPQYYDISHMYARKRISMDSEDDLFDYDYDQEEDDEDFMDGIPLQDEFDEQKPPNKQFFKTKKNKQNNNEKKPPKPSQVCKQRQIKRK